MNNRFNQFAEGRFARVQPRDWQSIPFADNRATRRSIYRAVGWLVVYAIILGISIVTIAQGEAEQHAKLHITETR